MKLINEKNEDLENGSYLVPPEFKKILGDRISGNNLTTRVSRLSNKENLSDEETKLLAWLNKKLDTETTKIDAPKRSLMKTGGQGSKKGGNAFKDTHDKDRDNTNVTKVGGLAKLTSSGKHSQASDQIENNRVQYYESFEAELKEMKYLIEYLNNNDKIIKS